MSDCGCTCDECACVDPEESAIIHQLSIFMKEKGCSIRKSDGSTIALHIDKNNLHSIKLIDNEIITNDCYLEHNYDCSNPGTDLEEICLEFYDDAIDSKHRAIRWVLWLGILLFALQTMLVQLVFGSDALNWATAVSYCLVMVTLVKPSRYIRLKIKRWIYD